MSVLARLKAWFSGRPRSAPLATRHERREAARKRHSETGEPLWTSDDRHLGPDGERWVEDVSPGTPGHFGSVRSSRDD